MTEQARATTEHAWRDLPNNRPWSDWEPCDKSPHDGTKDWRHREVEQQADPARATGKRWTLHFRKDREGGVFHTARECTRCDLDVLDAAPVLVVPAADLAQAEKERDGAIRANVKLLGAKPASEVFDLLDRAKQAEKELQSLICSDYCGSKGHTKRCVELSARLDREKGKT